METNGFQKKNSQSGRKIMKPVFKKLMVDLKAIYTDSWFLPEDNLAASIDAWYKTLGDLTIDQLRRGIEAYVANNSKPPAPSQIRELALKNEAAPDPLEGFILWEARDRTTGLRVCQDILASPKDTAEDILNYIGQAVDISNVTLRRTTS